jgi:hypothetical protein
VRREERRIQIQILAPGHLHDDENEQRKDGRIQNRPWKLRGFKVEPVRDIAQIDGDPVPEVRPVLVEGQGPTGSGTSSPHRWRPPAIR